MIRLKNFLKNNKEMQEIKNSENYYDFIKPTIKKIFKENHKNFTERDEAFLLYILYIIKYNGITSKLTRYNFHKSFDTYRISRFLEVGIFNNKRDCLISVDNKNYVYVLSKNDKRKKQRIIQDKIEDFCFDIDKKILDIFFRNGFR